MEVYSYSEAKQNFESILDKASKKGGIKIRRKNGEVLIIKPEKTTRSPFDIDGIDTDITTNEIIKFIREGRKR